MPPHITNCFQLLLIKGPICDYDKTFKTIAQIFAEKCDDIRKIRGRRWLTSLKAYLIARTIRRSYMSDCTLCLLKRTENLLVPFFYIETIGASIVTV